MRGYGFVALVFVFLLLGFTAIACAVNTSMLVPAVVSTGEGEMIGLHVEVREGQGYVYTTTEPLVGIDTQNSERTAVSVAMEMAGAEENDYDVFLTMDVGETRQVDGPSAGAAMTLLTMSALEGKPIRRDFTITGTIEEDGSVGAVGGVPSKVEAAARSGMTVVAVPAVGDAYDKILLVALRSKLNLTIIEVSNIEEAAGIAFSPQGSELEAPGVILPRLSGVPQYEYNCSNCRLPLFQAISQKVVGEAAGAVANASSSGREEYSIVTPLLEKGVADSNEMYSKGYYYTAANNAFLTLIDARLLENADIDRRGLGVELSNAQRCVDSLQRPNITRENLEFVAGGDLRATWARMRLEEARERELNVSNAEELLAVYRDAINVEAWCEVAGELYSTAASIGGEKVNESVLQGLAQAKISEARMAYASNPDFGGDSEMHLRGANKAFNSSFYAAAILDADYVLGSAAIENFSGMDEGELVAKTHALSSRKGKTLWSALFYAHSSFYAETQGPGGIGSALRLACIAERMEGDVTTISYLFEHPESAPPAWTPTPMPQAAKEDLVKLNESLLFLIIVLSVLLVVSAALNIIVFTRMKVELKSRAVGVAKAPKAPSRISAKGKRR